VAEGIERSPQRDGLQALGCRLGQGYYFGEAASRPETEELLRRLLRTAA
jgi:EAL domain-containing protein (putative c-di-GMP-specific phosphodiesterase class I)